jgi:hypothetical protein
MRCVSLAALLFILGIPLTALGTAAVFTDIGASPAATEARQRSIALADLDGDGILDAAVADFLSDSVLLLKGDANGGFQISAKLNACSGPRSIVAADFNRDGVIDLAVACFISGELAVYLGRGDGSFADPQFVKLGQGLVALAASDFDSDGIPDLAAGNFFTGDLYFLRGLGNGSFLSPVRIGWGHGLTRLRCADVDGDGVQDLIVTDASRASDWALLGDGRGGFREVGTLQGTAVSVTKPEALGIRHEAMEAIRQLLGMDDSDERSVQNSMDSIRQVLSSLSMSQASRGAIHFLLADAEWRLRTDDVSAVRDLVDVLGLLTAETGIAGAASENGPVLKVKQAIDTLLLYAAPARYNAGGTISCGQTIIGNILTGAQQDSYTFSGNAGEAVVITAGRVVGYSSINLCMVAELYDPSGHKIATNSCNGKTASILLSSTGIYTFLVRDNDFYDTGQYSVSLGFTTGRCGSISCGQTLTPNIATGAQQDVYAFSGIAGEAVVITAGRVVGNSSINLCMVAELYDPSGNLIGTNTCNGKTTSVPLASTGKYTILVRDNDFYDTGQYSVSLGFTTGRCGSISCGQTLTPNIATGAQQDVYAFSGIAGEAVVITAGRVVGNSSINLCMVAELYDPSGNLIGTNTCNGKTTSVPLASTGKYTILVRDNDFYDTGQYSVSLGFTTGRCGTDLACGQSTAGNIVSGAQQDVFKFCGRTGGSVTFSAARVSGESSGNLCMIAELYDPSGNFAAANSCNGSSGTVSLTGSGTYTLLVRDNDFYDTGKYTVSLSCAGPTCTCEYFIDPTSQTFGPSGGTGAVSVTTTAGCSWTAASNADWITITSGSSGSGNGTVNYSVSAATGNRTGTCTIAGQTLTVNQTGPASSTTDLILGLGPGGGGWIEIRGDANSGYAHTSWIQVPWDAYNSTNGETRPASGDLNGDGKNELVVGLGRGGHGWVEIRSNSSSGYAHSAWVQVPWTSYNEANGETRPVIADVDGDGKGEIIIGLGSGSQGWIEIRGNASTGYAHLAWVQLGWPAYNAANGATRPAAGDLNGDGKSEIVVGLGSGSSGWVEILGNASTGYAHLAWIQLPWDPYILADGETRPAVGDLDGDGKAEIVLGLGSTGNAQGWVEIRGNASTGYAHSTWVQLGWAAYNSSSGEIHPAIKDLDGDGKGEIILGLGTGGAGWVQILGNTSNAYAHRAWVQVPWDSYNVANGTTNPSP